MRRKLLALGLGTIVTLLTFEIVLRLIGAQELLLRDVRNPDVHSYRPRIMFVGNSHTMGTGAPIGKSYPDQFRDRLKKRYGESPFEVLNLGRGNANSSFVAGEVPRFLEKYHPEIVVLMTGETNFWNHLGYSDFVEYQNSESKSYWLQFYDWAYALRTFRFIQLFDEFVIRSKREFRFFSDYEEDDRAWIWVAVINAGNMFETAKMSASEAQDAYQTIARYIQNHGASVSLLETMIDIGLKGCGGTRDCELDWQSRIQQLSDEFFPNSYSYFLDRLANVYHQNNANSVLRSVGETMKLRRPANFPDLLEVADFHQEATTYREKPLSEQIEFYTQVLSAFPTHAFARMFLIAKLRKAGSLAAALKVAQEGIELNPLANQSNWMREIANIQDDLTRTSPPEAQEILREIEKFRADFSRRFPRHRGRIARISDDEILKWVEYDLERIRKEVNSGGAKLMLQTYPTERWGDEKLVDQLIRRFAKEHYLPLSDTSRELVRFEPDPKKREDLFTKILGDRDNHLGENGYALIAALLEKDFEEEGWLPEITKATAPKRE